MLTKIRGQFDPKRASPRLVKDSPTFKNFSISAIHYYSSLFGSHPPDYYKAETFDVIPKLLRGQNWPQEPLLRLKIIVSEDSGLNFTQQGSGSCGKNA